MLHSSARLRNQKYQSDIFAKLNIYSNTMSAFLNQIVKYLRVPNMIGTTNNRKQKHTSITVKDG